MTTFSTSESPFKSDNTASNQCGVTLMNNPVGAVVAKVMATHDNNIVDAMRRRVVELDLGKVVRDQARGVYGVGR